MARSWWTLRSLVSTQRSASPAMPVSSVALGRDAVDEPAVALQRVLAPVGLVAADQHLVAGVHVDAPAGGARPRPGRGAPPARSLENARLRTSTTAANRRRSPRAPSSTMGSSSAGGRLSTTNQPRSSSTRPALSLPAPDRPVTTTTSSGWVSVLAGPAGGAPRRGRRARRPVPSASAESLTRPPGRPRRCRRRPAWARRAPRDPAAPWSLGRGVGVGGRRRVGRARRRRPARPPPCAGRCPGRP